MDVSIYWDEWEEGEIKGWGKDSSGKFALFLFAFLLHVFAFSFFLFILFICCYKTLVEETAKPLNLNIM